MSEHKTPTQLLLAALQDAVTSAEFAMDTELAPRSIFSLWLENAKEAIGAAKNDEVPEGAEVIMTLEETERRLPRVRVVRFGDDDCQVQIFKKYQTRWVTVGTWSQESNAIADALEWV